MVTSGNPAPAVKAAEEKRGLGLGTSPVFLASISTILGAVMFLRFGYAVGHVGLFGSLLIILLGHMVTIPTALALAEIATNRQVEGGGEYFIISRSFGTTIGGTIGLSLYLSQALSMAFYMIAFAEAFSSLAPLIESYAGIPFDARLISLPASLILILGVIFRGAAIGVKILWLVAALLVVSLISFFLGSPVQGSAASEQAALKGLQVHDPFILVFAICFPAFTGMTAGVGLSGDLANPRRSIPLGVISATLIGLLIYILLVFKLSYSASSADLAGDQLIMSRIALWGPIIPIGLGCATLSSAIGSILVAPRTMQALGKDKIFPNQNINSFLSQGKGDANEPRNATIVTGLIALSVVAVGNVDFVARIISMFFMLTYGALCTISFLEHFAARINYRPAFRSRWYVSFFGALMCLFLMFQMDPLYAVIALSAMLFLYKGIQKSREGYSYNLGEIFYGAMTQATRFSQVKLQKSLSGKRLSNWRPSIVMVNSRTFDRSAPMLFFSWLCYRYGFGTYLHYIQGEFDIKTLRESRQSLAELIKYVQDRQSHIYMDTVISPSLRSAILQSVQAPGIFGVENNTNFFEFSVHDKKEVVNDIYESCVLTEITGMNNLVLRHGDHYYGNHGSIHIWITWNDHSNLNLMVLTAYIILAHPDWHHAEIRVFAAFPEEQIEEQTQKLNEIISTGRIPVSEKNIQIISTDASANFDHMVETRSHRADLVILGYTDERLKEKGSQLFLRHPKLNDVVFVNAQQRILIE
ncbi:amino acid permease [bacterium]|nr:amino acid permease [bacterium]